MKLPSIDKRGNITFMAPGGCTPRGNPPSRRFVPPFLQSQSSIEQTVKYKSVSEPEATNRGFAESALCDNGYYLR